MKREAAEILKDALALPTEARAALAGSLLESLDTEVDEDAEAAWATEVNRRVAELDSGAVKTILWAEVRRRRSVASRDEWRVGLSRAFAIGSSVDCSAHWCAQTIARSQTRSRDVSDPVSDPGARVWPPAGGRSRPGCSPRCCWAAAKTAAASPSIRASHRPQTLTAYSVARTGLAPQVRTIAVTCGPLLP